MTGAEPVAAETCGVEVGEPPHYFHFHRCNKPVKHIVTTRDGTEIGVCGIHKRQHDRHPLHIQHFVESIRKAAQR